jgi:hypothetical protein
VTRQSVAAAQAFRIGFRFVWAFVFCASVVATAEGCGPVRDVKDFVAAWNDAVIGPGGRSHACTLRMLTRDARITGVVMGKDGKSTRTVESPAEFVGWYEKRPKEMFWERTLHSTLDVYENVARVTRTYEVRASATGPVTAAGIEDFELIFDGAEWKAFSLLWQDATPGKPLPGRYLRDAR